MNVVSYTHYCISPRLWPDIQNKRINIEQFLSPSHDHHFQHCRPSTPAGATACSSVTQYIDVQFCYESSMVFSKYLSRYLFSLSLTQVSSPKCQSIFSVTFDHHRQFTCRLSLCLWSDKCVSPAAKTSRDFLFSLALSGRPECRRFCVHVYCNYV